MEHYFCYENSDEIVKAVNVETLDDYCLRVFFSNGKIRFFNVKPLLDKMTVFFPLKNKALFSTVKIRHNTVFWDYGKGIDLCASVLYWDGVDDNS
jgi:hypothetical protein